MLQVGELVELPRRPLPFCPKRLKHHQKIEVETRQIQRLHGVLPFDHSMRATVLNR